MCKFVSSAARARLLLLAGLSLALFTPAAAQESAPETPPPAESAATDEAAPDEAGTEESAPAEAPAQPGQEEDVITVVGSQIKGATVTDVLPVTILDADDIDAAAPASGDELFRAIPQSGDVTFNESRLAGGINDARGDTASINLRGLGTGNTLMLINGRRMVLHPAIQVENLVPVTTVNTNTIPVKGVRRIEVLRDGASAIYGTDAVAGVINTVLRDNFDGFTASFEFGHAVDSQMDEWEAEFAAGRTFNQGRSNISLFGYYRSRDPLFASEREFSRNADIRHLVAGTPFEGDTDFRNNSIDTPWAEFQKLNPNFTNNTSVTRYDGITLTTSGVFHVQPDIGDLVFNTGCVAPAGPNVCFDNSTVATTGTDQNLRYNDNHVSTLWGDVERLNLYSVFNHEFDSGTEFFAEAMYFKSDFLGQREQETNLGFQRLFIPIDAYYNPFGPVGSPNRLPNLTGVPTTGLPLELLDYRFVDAGPLLIEVDQYVYRLLGGLRGNFRGWDWETAVVHSRAETNDTMRQPSVTLLQEALARTTPDAYNPFNGGDPFNPGEGDATPNPQSVIDSFMVDISRISHTSMTLADFRVSKPDLFSLWAGPVGMAAGAEYRHETYGDDRDKRLDGTITFTDLTGEEFGSDVLGASPTPDTEGSRNVWSAFVEFAAPLVSPEMNVPLVHSIEVQAAARYEHYSVFGDVLVPKVAASWRPAEWLQFRGAWSQGFRAPNLPQIHERGIIRSNTRTDWIRCEALFRKGEIANFDDCSESNSVQSNRSGTEELTPEESEHLSAGLTFDSTFIPEKYGRIIFTADYWKVEQTDIIGILGDANAITLDYYLRVNGSSNPNVIRAAPTQDDIDLFDGSGLPAIGEVVQVIDNYRNLQPREVDGFDLSLLYDLDDTRFGDFSLRVNAARLLTFFQAPGEEQQLLLDAQANGEIDPTIFIGGAESLIEENGRPKWRGSLTFTWRYKGWGLGYFGRYVGAVNDTSATLADGTPWRVKEWLVHNLYAQYSFNHDGLLDDTRIRIGVRNLMNTPPSLADQDHGYIGDLHSPVGRFVYFSINKRF